MEKKHVLVNFPFNIEIFILIFGFFKAPLVVFSKIPKDFSPIVGVLGFQDDNSVNEEFEMKYFHPKKV